MQSVKMSKQIPGYTQEIIYGVDRGHKFITQHNVLVDCDTKEIAFYNDDRYTLPISPGTLVAVWHIKPYSSKLLKLNRVILAIHNSPNKSVQRAALWARLCKMRSQLTTIN